MIDKVTGVKQKTEANGVARRRLILAALPGTASDIAEKTGIPLSSVYYFLYRMPVYRRGPVREGHWVRRSKHGSA